MGLFDFFKKDKQAKDNLKKGMKRTSGKFQEGLSTIFLGKKTIDDELLENLEEFLITADIGPQAADMIIEKIRTEYTRGTLKDAERITDALKQTLTEILSDVEEFNEDMTNKPYVILVSGVNGAGKTTSIAKLANMYKNAGKSVMLIAGDTFRAAAAEQLSEWGNRLDIPVIRKEDGSDPAAVIHDGLTSAKSKNIDVVIADTAGRLHTKHNLMQELVKINKVAEKVLTYPVQESIIVLDATSGQNALTQAKMFKDAINVNGVILTKLDGTAKGGIALRIVNELHLPIRYIGFGESMEDLRPFNAENFVEAMFEKEANE